MNVYESMNKAMDKELEKVPTAKKLTESVEEIKPVVEFKAIEIPAPLIHTTEHFNQKNMRMLWDALTKIVQKMMLLITV